MSKYKSVEQRDWRQVELPEHELLEQTQQKIVAVLKQLGHASPAEMKTGLSALVYASINHAYREWVERHAEYSDKLHDKGVNLYAIVTHTNSDKKDKAVYVKADALEKIDAIGDYLAVTKQNLPQLHSPRNKRVYNRRLIILLAMNALAESLKPDVVK